jgi:hypothetical protein
MPFIFGVNLKMRCAARSVRPDSASLPLRERTRFRPKLKLSLVPFGALATDHGYLVELADSTIGVQPLAGRVDPMRDRR